MHCLVFRLFTLIALTLIACPALAQRERDSYLNNPLAPGEISGQVRLEDGSLVKNVTVRLERFGGGLIEEMMTDGSGKFRFSSLKRDNYTVTVRAPGFTVTPQQVDLQVVLRTQVMIDLRPEKSGVTSPPASSALLLDARVPVEAQKEFEKGQAALSEKKLAQALPYLEKAVSLYPGFFHAQFLLGTTYLEMSQWSKAESALRRALEINPQAAMVLVSLGEAYRRQKLYAEAEKALQEAIKLDDVSWQAHFTLGRIYWEKEELMKAGPAIGRTLQLKPDHPEAHLLGGNLFLRLSLPDRALIEYQEYLRLAPKGEFAKQTQELVQKLKRTLEAKKK